MSCNAVLVCDSTSLCDLVKVTGTVNTTDIKRNAIEYLLYAWRITIENCSDTRLCNANVALDLDFKTQTAETGGSIYQKIFGFPGIVNILTAPAPLPGFNPNLAWNGGINQTFPPITNLSTTPFTIPVGKVIIEVFAEVEKELLDQNVDCYVPALFPAIVELKFGLQNGTFCPTTISNFIGCSPKCVAVDFQPIV